MNKYLKSNILFEDEYCVFVNKQPGLLSIPDRFDQNKPHLKGILLSYYKEIYTLHKLDQNTSGIMIFAKTPESHKAHSGLFESREIVKEYLALSINNPSETKASINEPIREHKTKKGTYIISDIGKPSLTDYTVVQAWDGYSLVKLTLNTGRTHQIRVHLAYIGCPLLVDPTYGYYNEYFLSNIKRKKVNLKKGDSEKPLLTRTPLHASYLSFTSPLNGYKYAVNSPLPKDIKAICYQLNKRYGETGQAVEH